VKPTVRAEQALKQTGLKATLPRMRVLRLFQRATPRHWSAEDVYRALLAEASDVGLPTIYRVLAQLEQAGVLRRSRFDAERAVYELADGDHHDHIVCLDCGRVEEFTDAQIESRQAEVAAAQGFRLVDHSLSMYAHCTRPQCPHRPVRLRALEHPGSTVA
jgi:Fur family ferric uptake transcriptional regulator